ncbi:helix-turn-helix domain-containing protein [Bacillus altitudinis]|uniref:helix-turn-helix domain-containing protein n=1 Tax=Bacillus altitudinis TaxID=293387 RepID=UPI003D352044
MPNKKLETLIRSLRVKRKLTQKELANRIGLNNSVLSRIESGNRTVNDSEINLFADFFQVTTDYLLGRTEYAKKFYIK